MARREFVERGFHAVSIRDIAKEAGLSLSVLYHYYASKQELLYGVLNEAIDSFHKILERHSADSTTDPVQHFLVLVDSMVEYRAKLRVDSLLFIREIRNLEPDYARRLSTRQADVVGLFDAAIAAGLAAGVFHTPYPDDARRTLIAALNAIPEWYRPSGTIGIDELTKRYRRLALALMEYGTDGDGGAGV
ncbi:TetR/AcrR family transcriptional regulator [Mycobacterium vicinigordonae]|uniref:TetR/AcrR family transcriptional regulator n=1 Tax=Mycobacterium vicinigordonae TaxID=1719132 RepID=A0A7D6DZM7_9MYCO|nr:TetR/AcrR family transcriptional regulator [Mycobacterium vicinigordonae]QLL06381.1 TetR/AcrR family transcriptional regulator [Mycobacterium vicinigordonae]